MKYGVFSTDRTNGETNFREAYVHFRALEDAGFLNILFAGEVPKVDLTRYGNGFMGTSRTLVEQMRLDKRYIVVVAEIFREEDLRETMKSGDRLGLRQAFFEYAKPRERKD